MGPGSKGRPARRLFRLREFYQAQVRLWGCYGRRYELSGLETRALLAPPTPLRWSGGRLEGTVLPESTDSP